MGVLITSGASEARMGGSSVSSEQEALSHLSFRYIVAKISYSSLISKCFGEVKFCNPYPLW